MGVYISNMEMPTSCYDCPMAMKDYTTLFGKNFKQTRNSYACVLTHKAITSTKRNRFCPLVEIPPHGRLIDADALYKTIDATSERTIGHTTFKETVLLDIRGMPTILESTMGQVNSEKAINEKCGFEP